MISRKTSLAISEIYVYKFTSSSSYNTGGTRHITYTVEHNKLYDFLYEYDYPSWLCNLAKGTHKYGSSFSIATRPLKEFILKLHTGESMYANTKEWSWEQRQKLGQDCLYKLARDIIKYYESSKGPEKSNFDEYIDVLKQRLELDGYIYKNGQLLLPERDILDVEQETNLLESLYTSFPLANKNRSFQYLSLSEEHYINGRWGDSIHNSRLWLESVLQEVAAAHSLQNGSSLAENTYNSPRLVRDYLKDNNLLERQEKDTLSANYGLLSGAGSHPNMSEKDHARLLRQQALLWSQFVMLRFQGSKTAAKT